MDWRHSSRLAVRYSIAYLSTSSRTALAGEGTVINLSRAGLAIASSLPVPPGIELMCRVSLPDHPKPLFIPRATVRWSQGGEFGLTTTRMGDEDQRRLDTFVVEWVPDSCVTSLGSRRE